MKLLFKCPLKAVFINLHYWAYYYEATLHLLPFLECTFTVTSCLSLIDLIEIIIVRLAIIHKYSTVKKTQSSLYDWHLEQVQPISYSSDSKYCCLLLLGVLIIPTHEKWYHSLHFPSQRIHFSIPPPVPFLTPHVPAVCDNKPIIFAEKIIIFHGTVINLPFFGFLDLCGRD